MSAGLPRDPGDGGRRIRRRLARQLRLSALALLWERLWPALWPASATAGVFAVVTLLGLWEAVPWPWLHAALLAGFAGALIAALWRARGAVRRPALDAAVRRLERESGLEHRPLSAFLDSPAGGAGDPGRDALWRAHRRRAARALERLRVAWPRPALAARDPWALRALLLLALAVALVFAGDGVGDRFASALAFDRDRAAGPPGRLTAWVDPPAHTGLAPLFLTPAGGVAPGAPAPGGEHETVAGSVLNARVLGGGEAPAFVVDAGSAGQEGDSSAFEAAGEGNWTLHRAIESDMEARIVQSGRDLGAWSFSAVADRPPTVAVGEPPRATRRGVLRLAYEAEDDFGLAAIDARIRLPDGAGEGGDAWPIAFALPLPGLAPGKAAESVYRDLTAHPFAGSPVVLDLGATDSAGQRGFAAPYPMVLPARPFAHPVAIEIVARRRALALDRGVGEDVVAALEAVMAAPEAFSGDPVAFLGLAAARTRLAHAESEAEYRGVIDLLWDVALRIEDGALSAAERELRTAQEELRAALDEGADPEELAEMMDRLRETLDRYLETLAQSRRERDTAENGEEADFEPGALRRGRDDLQRMIDDARALAETGARDAARDMLRQLRELLENMEPARPEADPQSAGGERLMEQLREIMEGQDELLEETFRRAQQGGENERESPGQGEDAVERQEALRRALGEFMRQLGESGAQLPDPLGEAEQAMRESTRELGRGRPDRSADAQAEALGLLQQGAEMAMNETMAGRSGQRPGRDDAPSRERRDPFGRLPPGNNGDPAGFVDIPGESAVQRSREIRDELRRRAGERARSRTDLDYIGRLLDMY